MSKFNVEKYRDPDECRSSWNLRRRFLLANHENLPMDRLVCLAQCFVNVELYGNKYPTPVMIQLKELTKGMPELVEEKKAREKRKYATMNFVKASPSDGTGEASKPGQGSVEKKMGFVKSDDSYQSTDIKSSEYQNIDQAAVAAPPSSRAHFNMDDPPPRKKSKKKKEAVEVEVETLDTDQTFALLRHTVRQLNKSPRDNPISVLNMALQKVRMAMNCEFEGKGMDGINMFECKVSLDSIFIASGLCKNKKSAKKIAFENAINEIVKAHHRILKKGDGSKELQSSDSPFDEPEETEDDQEDDPEYNPNEDDGTLPNGELTYETNAMNIGFTNVTRTKRRPFGSSCKSLDELIFLDNCNSSLTATGMLRQSADFSKMLLEFDFTPCAEGVACRITLEGQPLVECTEPTKAAAKNEASENAVDLLKKMCWTIKIKQAADSDASSLSKDEIIGDVEKSMCVIPDSNVGNKLLRKMGWAGGGVGKDGTGREEPVTLDQVVNREGLGLDSKKGISGGFKDKIKKCVENYASSDDPDDLVFAPDFRKEERAVIHQHCQRLGLKSHSHGSGEERYLVISRKRSPAQLFYHIMSKGGSTSKYELIPPNR